MSVTARLCEFVRDALPRCFLVAAPTTLNAPNAIGVTGICRRSERNIDAEIMRCGCLRLTASATNTNSPPSSPTSEFSLSVLTCGARSRRATSCQRPKCQPRLRAGVVDWGFLAGRLSRRFPSGVEMVESCERPALLVPVCGPGSTTAPATRDLAGFGGGNRASSRLASLERSRGHAKTVVSGKHRRIGSLPNP
jgi:hypothetical protein